MKKLLIAITCVLLVVSGLFINVYAKGAAADQIGGGTGGSGNSESLGRPSEPNDPIVKDPGYNSSSVDHALKTKLWDIWATVAVLVQILAVACVVFAGLRYMFASADQKADIKQGLIYLTVGAVVVFGAVSIIQFVAHSAEEIL